MAKSVKIPIGNHKSKIKGQIIQWPKCEDTNGQSEVENQRTDNTMAKRQRTEGQTMIYKTLHRKLKIEQQEPH
jgi:hypothetical protein